MPSDHVIKDEPGFVAAVRRAAEVAADRQARAVRHRARARRTPATATSGAARRWRASTAPIAVDAFTEKPDRQTAEGYLGDRQLLLEQRHLRVRRAHVPGGAGAPRARHPRRRQAALADAREDLGFLRLGRRGLRAGAQHLHRLCRDGAHELRRRAADRRRLERCRLLVVAVGAERARCAGQRRQGRCAAGSHPGLLHPFRAGAGRHHRRQGSRHRRHARCAAGGRPVEAAGRVRHRRPAARRRAARSTRATCATTGRGASSRRSSLGAALPGQAAARQAGRASSPCRCTITAPSTGWWCTARPR